MAPNNKKSGKILNNYGNIVNRIA